METNMNNLIQELAKQATIRVNNPIVNSYGKIVCDDWEEGISISKFAELIIRKCANFVDTGISDGGVDGRSLKEHFGIKE
jgi:hypothetical protein